MKVADTTLALRLLSVLLATTFVLSTTSAEALTLSLFNDDFEADSPGDVLDSGTVPINNWTRLTGTITGTADVVTIIQDGSDSANSTNVMESNPTGSDFIFTSTIAGFNKPQNLRLSSDIRLLADGTGVVNLNFGDDELGGMNNVPVDRYGITIAEAAGDDTISLTKVDGTITSNILGPTVPFSGFSALDWHNYELLVTFGDTNDTLSVLVDGTPIFSNVLNSALDFDPVLFTYVGNGGGRQVRFDNFSLTTEVPVPEPSSFGLLLIGFTSLFSRARRKAKPAGN